MERPPSWDKDPLLGLMADLPWWVMGRPYFDHHSIPMKGDLWDCLLGNKTRHDVPHVVEVDAFLTLFVV